MLCGAGNRIFSSEPEILSPALGPDSRSRGLDVSSHRKGMLVEHLGLREGMYVRVRGCDPGVCNV